jgi:hypothetical protein
VAAVEDIGPDSVVRDDGDRLDTALGELVGEFDQGCVSRLAPAPRARHLLAGACRFRDLVERFDDLVLVDEPEPRRRIEVSPGLGSVSPGAR